MSRDPRAVPGSAVAWVGAWGVACAPTPCAARPRAAKRRVAVRVKSRVPPAHVWQAKVRVMEWPAWEAWAEASVKGRWRRVASSCGGG